MAQDHNRVIDAEARQALKPLGLYRKGKSRVWYDDHGWWLIQVEFQPSAWFRGSYLNVGISASSAFLRWNLNPGYTKIGQACIRIKLGR